jgi:4-aminobutyrate aminotransferase-like enzyme
MTEDRNPGITTKALHAFLESAYALSGELRSLPGYLDQNFRLTTATGEKFVVKVAQGSHPGEALDLQNRVMTSLAAKGFPVPVVVPSRDGGLVTQVAGGGGGTFNLRVLTFLPGVFYADVPAERHTQKLWRDLGALLGGIDSALQEFTPLPQTGVDQWDLAHGYVICRNAMHLLDSEQAGLVECFLERYRQDVLPWIGELPRSLIHNDANDHNLLVDDANSPSRVVGLIDFGDLAYTHTVNELAIAAAYALMGQASPVEALVQLVAGYHAARPLGAAEIDALFGLVTLRLCTTVCHAAAELRRRPENEYLQVSARPALDLLAKLRGMSSFAITCELRRACGLPTDTGRTRQAIIDARLDSVGRSLSLNFEEPLKIVRGEGVHLFDEQGRDYLDMVNNVCHVGHCHPHVVAAGQAQMARLNTNTRFLNDNLVDYAERLLATMPDELSVCMFVNSGSEANELALRLASTFTGSREQVVVDGAYHGNTRACIDASPYKFDGPGGEGAPDHVHKVLLPDPYRGPFAGMNESTGRQYAEDVARVVDEIVAKDRKPGAFISESLQGVAGQIIMPDGYLRAAYSVVRDAGGVCIADEVQVGFGRVGTHMWAFETQGVVPDILTLGKPIGNGHPMAAVIMTRDIADAFVTGMEYFNTFGGNPVSCAIGMAVLNVIRDEGLQQNALTTGAYVQDGLRELQQEFEMIGDVRGLGLFIGAELVVDRDDKTPATEQTAALVEHLKQEHRIILSTEGPFHNVLKIKPPIVFGRRDADRFLAALREGLVHVR